MHETVTIEGSNAAGVGQSVRAMRRLIVWNGLVILGLGLLLSVTWLSQPVVTWSLNPVLRSIKQTQKWPESLVQFGTVQVVELPSSTTAAADKPEGTLLALMLFKGETASGIYIPPEELRLPIDGQFEISLCYAPMGEGELYFDWLSKENLQQNVVGNPQIPFTPSVAGQLLSNRIGPFDEKAVRGLGLRILTAGQVEVELIELMFTDVTALQQWRSDKS